MDGYAIARTIRQDAERKNVYLITIAGYADDEDQQLAKQAGFDEYCVKPGDLKFLDQMIKNGLCARPRQRVVQFTAPLSADCLPTLASSYGASLQNF